MSEFDFSTLITDRTNADVSALSALMAKKLDTWTQEELEQFNSGLLKGGYWWTDLNRVTACMEYINRELQGLGYETGYKPVEIVRPGVPGVGRLPDGYVELEYIESNGSQVIDTGLTLTPDLSLSAVFSFPKPSGYRYCGSFFSGSTLLYGIGQYFELYYGSTYKITDIVGDTSKHSVEIDSTNKKFVFDGKEYPFSSGFASIPNSLRIFVTDSSSPTFVNMRLFQQKNYVSGQMVRDFVPCKSPDGDVGLYDLVISKFYSNSGSGNFLAGPEVDIPLQPNPLDPYVWVKEDSQTMSQMAQYLANVAAIRSVFTLPEYVPQTPESMALLTFAKANDIESVLLAVENIITVARKTLVACGPATCGGDYL